MDYLDVEQGIIDEFIKEQGLRTRPDRVKRVSTVARQVAPTTD